MTTSTGTWAADKAGSEVRFVKARKVETPADIEVLGRRIEAGVSGLREVENCALSDSDRA